MRAGQAAGYTIDETQQNCLFFGSDAGTFVMKCGLGWLTAVFIKETRAGRDTERGNNSESGTCHQHA